MSRMNNQILNLVSANKDKKREFTIQQNGDAVDIYLYDIIGYWMDETEMLVRDIRAITASTINLRINSPGGDVFDAVAIKSALKEHSAEVVAHVEGMCASAATNIVMGADRSEIVPGSRFMIHNAWTLAVGDRHEHMSTADLLQSIDTEMAAFYAEKTGMDAEQISNLMDAETWFAAQEAVDAGFIDAVKGQDSGDASALARWDLSAYKNAPKVDASNNDGRARALRRLEMLKRTA